MTKIKLLLRELRQANDLSQEELAKALNLSRQSIISLEQGEYLPSSPVLLAMLEYFSCPIEQLIGGVNFQYQVVEKLEPKKGGERTMEMIPWSPFEAIDNMQDEVNNIVERTFNRGDWSRSLATSAGAMNIHESDKDYEIEIQVPGYEEKDLNLEVSENTLTISGNKKIDESKDGKNLVRREWQHSEFSRSIRFATQIKDSDIEAKLNNGTLTITAPKVEPVKPKVKKIVVKKK